MPERTLDLQNFDALIADLDNLLARGCTASGQWSLGQTCQHIEIGLRNAMRGVAPKFPFLLKLFGPMIRNMILRQRRFQRGIKADAMFLPQDHVDDAQAVASLKATVQQFLAQPDYPPSPVFGRMTREQWHQFHLIHASHHLKLLHPR